MVATPLFLFFPSRRDLVFLLVWYIMRQTWSYRRVKKMNQKQTVAVVAAAGAGRRMVSDRPKLLHEIGGEPVLLLTLKALALPEIKAFFLVLSPTVKDEVMSLLVEKFPGRLLLPVLGGEKRQDSVLAGLQAAAGWEGWTVPEEERLVLIHDGARPLVDKECIRRVMAAAARTGAAAPGVPVKDTIKKIGENGIVLETPDRRTLWAVQTPQVFSWPVIYGAYIKAEQEGWEGTDDCSLVEKAGYPVQIVAGSYRNLKITTPEDLLTARALAGEESGPKYRVGQGFDVHRLVPGRRLVLGGVEIPGPLGLDGHSDADVAVHAVIDALLGAAGLGDIGEFFPDNDPRFRNIDSCLLLEMAMKKIKEAGFVPVNVDLTLVAERPKLAPYRAEMKKNLAALLGLEEKEVGVKATTTEGLGFTGRGLGIAAQAVVLVKNFT